VREAIKIKEINEERERKTEEMDRQIK